ncbi:hypothetical protein D9757_009592 [Collybiopsis confluens]|uniref:6-phosphogluconate dehydrogenase C-terminal domain-like protein n=1 Tax=Collybiopsis confluens TaxID=2823264 RepID=A0A8H5M0R9_9AGAR|nr:hypothetical protein D9757_009592 [Collybiopsis confluens]
MKDVLLVGLGAVGSVLSYSLNLSQRVRLTTVARGNYKQIQNAGMNLKSERYGDIKGWKPDRVVSSVADAADRQYSHVMLATKCIPEVIKTPEILKPLLSPPYSNRFQQPTYVLLQNGLNIERDLYHAIKSLGQSEPRIVNTGIYLLANQVAPNVVTHGPFVQMFLGLYRHNDFTTTVNSPQEQALLENLKGLYHAKCRCHYISRDSTQEICEKYDKRCVFWLELSDKFNRFSLSAVYRPPPTDTPYQPYVEPATADRVEKYTKGWIRDILMELVTLGRALGYPDSEDGLPSSIMQQYMTTLEKDYSTPSIDHRPSTLLDIENGYPLEVEVIWGELVRMAKERNVDIPRIEMSYAILVLVQNQILRQRNSKLLRENTGLAGKV